MLVDSHPSIIKLLIFDQWQSIFNLNNFYHANDYASKADHLSYANLYTAIFFQYLATFARGSINGISDEIFSYIAYIPNIIIDLTNFSYDNVSNSTNIIGGSWLENSSIEKNLNIGNQLNVTNILSHNLTSKQKKFKKFYSL